MAQTVTVGGIVTIATNATGTDLASAPGADHWTHANLQPRNGVLLIGAEPGAPAVLVAPTLLARERDGTIWFDVGSIVADGGDLELADGEGKAVPIRDVLAWADRLWVKSATVTGGVNIRLRMLETME